MTAVKEGAAVPDFLRMDQPVSSDPANAKKTGNWHGWPTKDLTPVTLTDDEGRTVRTFRPGKRRNWSKLSRSGALTSPSTFRSQAMVSTTGGTAKCWTV